MSELYATSTVAMSAYNLLVLSGDFISSSRIFKEIEKQAHPSLKRLQLTQALSALKSRGLVVSGRKGFKIKDRQRRPIASREKSGDGWNGWKIRDPQRGLIPIEVVQ